MTKTRKVCLICQGSTALLSVLPLSVLPLSALPLSALPLSALPPCMTSCVSVLLSTSARVCHPPKMTPTLRSSCHLILGYMAPETDITANVSSDMPIANKMISTVSIPITFNQVHAYSMFSTPRFLLNGCVVFVLVCLLACLHWND